MIFTVNGYQTHGGLADRLKGMMTTYFLSKIKEMNFYNFYTYPFDFNIIWYNPDINITQLVVNPFKLKIHSIDSSKMKLGYEYFLNIKYKDRTNLIFSNANLLSIDLNNKPWQPTFTNYYMELKRLFEDKLSQNFKESYPDIVVGGYHVVHFRCMNYFGDFEDSQLPGLKEEVHDNIIDVIANKLKVQLKSSIYDPYFIIADSRKLLVALNEKGFSVFDVGSTAHIDISGASIEDYMRGFFEFYLLEHAKSIESTVLYHKNKPFNSHYAYVASILGDVPFEKHSFNVNSLAYTS